MSSILFEIKEQVGVITLNRPGKLNAFNGEMALLLQEHLDRCNNDDIRCVLITGAGKGFSAGQDLEEVTDSNGPGFNTILLKHYNPIIGRIRKLEKPVVAAINGVAAGAGANIALCCDVVVAAESASIIQSFSKIGLVPDSGGSYILPRLIGWQKASALLMLGEKVSAADAEKMGMIYKVIADNVFLQEALNIAQQLANMPTKGLAYTKQLLNNSFVNSFEEQLLEENIFQQKAAQTDDYKEGVAAFLEKRRASFQGK